MYKKTNYRSSNHLANAEDVSEPGGEDVALGVLDVDDVEWAGVLLPERNQMRAGTEMANLKLVFSISVCEQLEGSIIVIRKSLQGFSS